MAERFAKWTSGLTKTSKVAFGKLASILGVSDISQEMWDDLEALLLQADLGIETTANILENLNRIARTNGMIRANELWDALRRDLRTRLETPGQFTVTNKPMVILMVGVNGSGKTTTIAKLGKRLREDGMSILFGAADTFRAAAVDQLQVWGDRLEVDVVAGGPESDPGAVAFNAIQAGIARNIDIILIDTAGRLQTKFNLMEELKKIHRVIGKALPGAPHEIWLVLDAATGQNAMNQAKAFKDAVGVTGIILTKLDSSARGGMAFSIQQELGLPIVFAGLGEKPEDLILFDPDAFIDGILNQN